MCVEFFSLQRPAERLDFVTAEDEHGSIVDREVGEAEMELKCISTDGNESVGDVGVEIGSFVSL